MVGARCWSSRWGLTFWSTGVRQRELTEMTWDLWNLKACPHRYDSSDEATPSSPSQTVAPNWGPSTETDELVEAILIQAPTSLVLWLGITVAVCRLGPMGTTPQCTGEAGSGGSQWKFSLSRGKMDIMAITRLEWPRNAREMAQWRSLLWTGSSWSVTQVSVVVKQLISGVVPY